MWMWLFLVGMIIQSSGPHVKRSKYFTYKKLHQSLHEIALVLLVAKVSLPVAS